MNLRWVYVCCNHKWDVLMGGGLVNFLFGILAFIVLSYTLCSLLLFDGFLRLRCPRMMGNWKGFSCVFSRTVPFMCFYANEDFLVQPLCFLVHFCVTCVLQKKSLVLCSLSGIQWVICLFANCLGDNFFWYFLMIFSCIGVRADPVLAFGICSDFWYL